MLEDRLAQQDSADKGLWLVGGKYTIADIACFSWVNWHSWAGVEVSPFPKTQEWLDAINARPAIEKGLNVPVKFEMKEAMKSREKEEEYQKMHSGWVIKGQSADQEKHH